MNPGETHTQAKGREARAADRHYDASERDARRAAAYYQRAGEQRRMATWLSGRPGMHGDLGTPASRDTSARDWLHLADVMLDSAFREMDWARECNRRARDHRARAAARQAAPAACVVCTATRPAGLPPLPGPVTGTAAGHPVHPAACARDARSAQQYAADGSLAVDAAGVGRWTTNGQVIMDDMAALMCAMDLAPGLDPAATRTARDTETAAFLTAYRDREATRVRSPEELAEMRAAFGPGAAVVDVITGTEIRL